MIQSPTASAHGESALSSMAEQGTHNPLVAGSSPAARTRLLHKFYTPCHISWCGVFFFIYVVVCL